MCIHIVSWLFPRQAPFADSGKDLPEALLMLAAKYIESLILQIYEKLDATSLLRRIVRWPL